jgi:hypothetical protein
MSDSLITEKESGQQPRETNLFLTVVWLIAILLLVSLTAVAVYITIDLARNDLLKVISWIGQNNPLSHISPRTGAPRWLLRLKLWLYHIDLTALWSRVLVLWLPLVIVMRLVKELVTKTTRSGWQIKVQTGIEEFLLLAGLAVFLIPFVGWFIPSIFRDGFMVEFENGVGPILMKALISLGILLGFAIVKPEVLRLLGNVALDTLLDTNIHVTKRCGNCHAIVTNDCEVGDRCPYCNAYWGDERYV